MQLPQATAQYAVRVRFGRYVARRLKRAGFDSLSSDVSKGTLAVRDAGRAVEDADGPIQDALADRDAAHDALDLAAQSARNALAGRSVDAVQQEPYTLIFDQGIGYYLAAPLDEEERRYNELTTRLEEHLPASDTVRKHAVKSIHEGLASYGTSANELAHARTAASMAATKLEHATEKWERQIERVYGVLVAEQGKAAAERFFPKQRAASSHKTPAAVSEKPAA